MNFKRRVKKLQGLMRTGAVLVSDPHDIFYYTGHQAGEGDQPLLLVRRQGKPVLFVSPLSGKLKVGYSEVRPLPGMGSLLKALPKKTGIDQHHIPAGLYLRLKKKSSIVQAGDLIKKPMEVKEPEEIERMKKAIQINKKVLAGVQVFGRSEEVVAREIELGFFKSNAVPSFETIVASGKNSGNYIHHIPSERRVGRGDMVIIDFGASWKWCVDAENTDFALLAVLAHGARGHDHALADFAADGSRFEIRDDDNLGADEIFGLVPRLDARADLAAFGRAVVELDLEQAIGIGMRFDGFDGGNSQVEIRELLEWNAGKRLG